MNVLGPLIFKSSRWVGWSLVGGGALAGLATSLVTAWSVLTEQQSSERMRFEEEAQNRFSSIAIRLGAQRQMMDSCGAFFAGHPAAEEKKFRDFARFMLKQNPSINTLAWAPCVAANQRASWESASGVPEKWTIRESSGTGELVPAAERPEYFPIAFSEPGRIEQALQGYDVGADKLVTGALRAARRSGRVRASSTLTPLRRNHIHNEFLLIVPVFADPAPVTPEASSTRDLSGIVLAELRLSEVLYPVLDGFKPVGIQVELQDDLVPPPDRRIFMYSDGTLDRSARLDGLAFKRRLTFAGQSWSVHCIPLREFYRRNVYLVPGLVLLGGIITTGMLTALLANLFRQGWRVDQLVDERTAQLERSNCILRREIEARIQAEEKLSLSLAEKEVLLREVQHRVRNNLQFICSLIRLQTGHLVDGDGIRLAGIVRNQVRSMALVYERLQSNSLTTIDFGEYVRHLAEEVLRANNGGGKEIALSFRLEPTLLNLDTAVPCGLIVNELLANTFEYAFPNRRNREEPNLVTVSLQVQEEGKYVLTVADNGWGLPEQVDLSSAPFVGLQVVGLLVEQLNGTITLEQNGGTRCVVAFREVHYPKRT